MIDKCCDVMSCLCAFIYKKEVYFKIVLVTDVVVYQTCQDFWISTVKWHIFMCSGTPNCTIFLLSLTANVCLLKSVHLRNNDSRETRLHKFSYK